MLVPFTARAEVNQTGAQIQPFCRMVVDANIRMNLQDASFMGSCSGMIGTLMVLGSYLPSNMRSCPPGQGNVLQGTKVFLKFLNEHPERLHEQAIILAIDSFRQAWPCPNSH